MKRKQLVAVHAAVKAAAGERAGIITTAINLPRPTWELLRRVAGERAITAGGRASVSGVIAALVEAHRKELEAELK